ncbi:MAG: hypothetical protein OXQ94_03890 [Gemmatimonadota bacterium]|nr:hypothetical protein [Gemmatimonadota bacterium]MDE2870816.1 hypothetical protein [Gemmatimonadota bacterium]
MDGIRDEAYVNSVREDPNREGLPHAGTNHGVYVTFDDGEWWQEFYPGLPNVPVTDVIPEHDELAMASHGRWFRELDSVGPLRQWEGGSGGVPGTEERDLELFEPVVGYGLGGGVVLAWWVGEGVGSTEDAKQDVIDATGLVVRAIEPAGEGEERERWNGSALSAGTGLKRVRWALRGLATHRAPLRHALWSSNVYVIMATLFPQSIPSRADDHGDLPHIMKFSGGRSSAALAFLMAENGHFRPERGDVILFANTSAEHPATYAFTRECKRRLEADFDLPFFWFEFCTVEDASRGHYVRRPSYRLVKDVPIEEDPLGYRSHGEVFEEMLSYQGMLPNPHTRSCTAKLKLHPSHQLLAEWLGRTVGPGHSGHYADRSYVTPASALTRYHWAGGKAPAKAYLRRIAYMTEQPPSRPMQRWQDYTGASLADHIHDRHAGPARMWGPNAEMHVTILDCGLMSPGALLGSCSDPCSRRVQVAGPAGCAISRRASAPASR